MDLPPPPRPRDMSQPSLGEHDHDERVEATPPVSPLFVSEGTSQSHGNKIKGLFTQKSAPTFSRKYQDSSLDADDTESELVAIPESDLSDSTLHNSSAPVNLCCFSHRAAKCMC